MTLSTLIPTSASDIVGVFDGQGNQVLENARPTGLSVNRSARKFTHPLENNASRADGKIILPNQITYGIVLQADEYEAAYAEIESYYLSSDELTIQTKVKSFDRMIIVDMPHDEDPQMFDAVVMSLTLEETQLGTTVIVANDPNFSTVNRGQLQPQEPSAEQDNQGSLLIRGIRSVFGG